jgi:MFS family permease
MPRKLYIGLKGNWLTFWVTVAYATDMTLYRYDTPRNDLVTRVIIFLVVMIREYLVVSSSPSLPQINGIENDQKLQSTVTAIYDMGFFLGAISTMLISEKLGRKNTISTGTTIMSIWRPLTDWRLWSSADVRRPSCCWNWKRHQHIDSPCLAERDVPS